MSEARNDGILYSGLSSVSAKKVQEAKDRKKEVKTEKRGQIINVAEPVFAEFAKEKAMLGELLLALVDPDSTEDKVLEHLEAVRLHRTWLLSFESRLKNVLKAKPKVKEVEDED